MWHVTVQEQGATTSKKSIISISVKTQEQGIYFPSAYGIGAIPNLNVPQAYEHKMNTNQKKRKREDHTVSTIRYNWQVFISRITTIGNRCIGDTSNPNVQRDINVKCDEFIECHSELKKIVNKMESVVRGKEEEMKGLMLSRGSAGIVGRKRRRRTNADHDKKEAGQKISGEIIKNEVVQVKPEEVITID